MFSLLMKKIRRTKKPPDVTDLCLAEDALETDLANSNIESIKCVASEPFFLDSNRHPISTTLVQGASESKSKNQMPSKDNQIKRVSSLSKFRVNLTPEQKIASVQLHKASSHTLAPSRLYPSLNRIDTPGFSSSSAKPKITKANESRSIHDIAEEICLKIEPRILYAATIEKVFKRLEEDAQKHILIIHNMLKISSKFEYNFNTELDFRKNYSHVNVYRKLHSFDDVKNCHKRANKPIDRKVSKTRHSVPVFQSYRKSLRCYNGQKLHIIDCD